MSFSCLLWLFISIHAPPRGATARKGDVLVRQKISIHAPPRGATAPSADQLTSIISHFNSRPSARGDVRSALYYNHKGGRFQFTPLREGRLRSGRRSRVPKDFNSRPSARGDHASAPPEYAGAISIHAPPRGATIAHASDYHLRQVFQFTPLREGRRILKPRLKKAYSYFNSRPSARGDEVNKNFFVW